MCASQHPRTWSHHRSVSACTPDLCSVSVPSAPIHQTPVLPLLGGCPQAGPSAKKYPLSNKIPMGEKEIRRCPETFTTVDPNSLHSHCSHLQLRTPAIFASAHLSWMELHRDYTAGPALYLESTYPTQPVSLHPACEGLPHQNQFVRSRRDDCSIRYTDINTRLQET